ncbi:MAG: hypothetical protein GX907_02860 [Clostridiaceae bacterium]|nr:hypothetical protein [Clostridiaceae bacterium]
MARLPELIAEAAVAAREDRREVKRIRLGLGEAAGLTRNREGGDFIDSQVYSVRFERADAQPVTLLHYACYPVKNSRSKHVSADYPGYIVSALAERGELGCYINVPCGDINPQVRMPDTMGTPEKLYEDRALDRMLGNFAATVCEAYVGSEFKSLPLNEIVGSGKAAGSDKGAGATDTAGTFSVEFIRAALPLRLLRPADMDAIVAKEGERYGADSHYLTVARAWRDYQSEQIVAKRRAGEPIFIENVGIYILRLGSLILVTIPYETFAEIARELRRRRPDLYWIVAGNAPNTYGYLPTRAALGRHDGYGYEAFGSSFLYRHIPFAPEAAERLVEQIIAALDW